MTAQEKFTAPRGGWPKICSIQRMQYLLTIAVALAVIAYHGAWRSVECPLLLSIAALVCIILKVRSNEQRKKKRAE